MSRGEIARCFWQCKGALPGGAEHGATTLIVHKERENFHDVWTRFMAPAAIVVPGEVLLDRYPGAPYRVCHPPVQLQARADAFLPLWRAASSAFRLRVTPPEVCAG